MNDCFLYGKKEIDYIKARDRRLGEVIDRIGPIRRGKRGGLFRAIVRNIVAQQISGKAAESILARLEAKFPALSPEILAGADMETLRSCGLSAKKAEYIREFAAKVRSGEFDIDAVAKMSDAEVITELSSLRGIGIWTAEMLLLFTLHRPDVLSFGDLGMHRGMRMVYRHRKITKEMFGRIRRRLSPCGSVASLYFWAVAGGAIPELTDPGQRRRGGE